MNSLFFNHALDKLGGTFIIRMKNNEKSVSLAERCAKSCVEVGQNYQYWDAYDGTKTDIEVPSHHNDIMSLIKVTNHYLTKAEVACALSHISLWAHCALIQKPILILEHDAIMIQKYPSHNLYNSICYLGGTEQATKNWAVGSIPPHATDGPNFHFICRAHAYSIDPIIAKNMLAYVIKMGIHSSLDMLIRTDIFPVHQMGLFAYDEYSGTTIPNRPKDGRNTIKNDFLEI